MTREEAYAQFGEAAWMMPQDVYGNVTAPLTLASSSPALAQGDWRSYADHYLGAMAGDVKTALGNINQSFDWSNAIKDAGTRYAALDGGLDPHRTPSTVLMQQIALAARDQNPQMPADYWNTIYNNLDPQRVSQAAEIQEWQSKQGDDDLETLLSIAGLGLGVSGLFGFNPFSGLGELFGGAGAGAAGEIAALTGSGVPVGGALGTGATAAGIGGSFLDGVSSFFKEYVGDPMSSVFDKASSFFDSALPSATKGAEVAGQVGMGGGSGGLGAAQQMAGLSTNPASVILDGAPTIMENAVAGYGAGVPSGTVVGSGIGGVAGGAGNSILDWAMKNKELATTGAQLVFGAMKGVGDRDAAKEMMDRRIQADQALLAQRTEEAKELDEWKRRFTQAGSFFDAPVPKANANATQLRRPDGSLVYSNGIIANQVGG